MTEETRSWAYTSPVMHVSGIRRGEPYAGVVSEEHASAIGSVLILWNIYETAFAKLSTAMYRFLSIPEKEWRRQPYGKQSELLLATMAGGLGEYVGLLRLMREIVDRSREPQLQRNALAHGAYSWTARSEGGIMVPTIEVRLERVPDRVFQFTAGTLRHLQYEIANLAGRLDEIVLPDHPGQWLERTLPSDEISLLRDVFSNRS